MRIGIGALLGVLGGPSTYGRELIRALSELETEHTFVVITDRPDLLPVASNLYRIKLGLSGNAMQALWDQWIPWISRRAEIDLFHGTKGILPIWGKIPSVVTIHDVAVRHQPETFSRLQRWHQGLLVPWTARRARHVITVSEHSRNDIIHELGLPSNRVTAIPLAVAEFFSPDPGPDDEAIAASLGLPHKFILYAGTVQPRKGVDRLVQAFSELGAGDLELVIAGRLRPGYTPAFLERRPERVRYLGTVSEAQLAVLYRRALLFCSPSSYEGFGLSVLEAMQSGCPVVVPDNSSLPEVAGDAALWLPDLAVESIRQGLMMLLNEPERRVRMRMAGLERARRFSWQNTARQTLAVYEEVARG